MTPTLIKTFKIPSSETIAFYAIDSTAALMSICVVNEPTIGAYLFPAYIFIINLVMVLLILRPKFYTRLS